jgi:hypothetical protein
MDAASFEVPRGFSRTYRSGQTRATVAQVWLAICGFVAVLGAVHFLSGFNLIDQARSGLVTQADANAFDGQTLVLQWVDTLLFFPTGIVFLAWLSRTVDNVPVLGAGRPSVTPGWSIGWWFVPVANFFKPYLIVRDLNTRLAPVALAAGNGLILVWWIAWIARYPAEVLQLGLGAPDNLDSLGGWFMAGVVYDVVTLVAAALAVLVVRQVQARAVARAAEMAIAMAPAAGTGLQDA